MGSKKKYRKVKRIILLLFIIFFAYFFIFGKCGIIKIISLKMESTRLDLQIETLRVKEVVLQRQIKLLKTDTLFIEKVARERLGMRK